MKYSIKKKDEGIIITITELSAGDFDWVHDYFRSLFELQLPRLLDDEVEEDDDNGHSSQELEDDSNGETICDN